MKGNRLATLVLAASLCAATGAPMTALASTSSSDAAHQLPIQSFSPANGTSEVRPDAPIVIKLDPTAMTYNRFRQQFEDGRFTVLLNQQPVPASYDASTHTITVQHADFQRYSNYTVVLETKAVANGNQASDNASSSFRFETGSAVGEATHVTVSLASPSVSVDNGGTLNVTAEDDYGDPATNTTVTLQGSGSGNARVPSAFSAASTTPVQNGSAAIHLSDLSAEAVSIHYQVSDSDYAADTATGTVIETFTPGPTASIVVTGPSTVAAGSNGNAYSALAEDAYGNSVSDGTQFSVMAQGAVTGITPSTNGNVSFSYAAPTQVGSDAITVQAGDSGYSAQYPVAIVPGAVDAGASKVSAAPKEIIAGGTVAVSVVPKDEYGNPLGSGQTVTATDGTATESLVWNQSKQDYEGSFTETNPGTISFTARVGETTLSTVPTVIVDPVVVSIVNTGTTSSLTLGSSATISFKVLSNGQPDAGVTVNFTSNNGSLSRSSAVTDINGNVSISATPSQVGTASITASLATGQSSTQTISVTSSTTVPTSQGTFISYTQPGWNWYGTFHFLNNGSPRGNVDPGSYATYSLNIPQGQTKTIQFFMPNGYFLNNEPMDVYINGVLEGVVSQSTGATNSTNTTGHDILLWQSTPLPAGPYSIKLVADPAPQYYYTSGINVYGIWLQ